MQIQHHKMQRRIVPQSFSVAAGRCRWALLYCVSILHSILGSQNAAHSINPQQQANLQVVS
jgi:hypothetical protein